MSADQKKAFFDAIAADPGSPATKLVFADWIAERGMESDHFVELALRWCAKHNKWPRHLKGKRGWRFYWVGTVEAAKKPHNITAHVLFNMKFLFCQNKDLWMMLIGFGFFLDMYRKELAI